MKLTEKWQRLFVRIFFAKVATFCHPLLWNDWLFLHKSGILSSTRVERLCELIWAEKGVDRKECEGSALSTWEALSRGQACPSLGRRKEFCESCWRCCVGGTLGTVAVLHSASPPSERGTAGCSLP